MATTSCVSLRGLGDKDFTVAGNVVTTKQTKITVERGDFHLLPKKVQKFVAEKAELMRPRAIYICDGSQREGEELIGKLVERGQLKPLKKYENNWIIRTDPKDVARVESKTWITTPEKYETVTRTPEGIKPIMGNWVSPDDFCKLLDERFPGCMAGRMMYVIPFSMGPVGSHLSKVGIELTDSVYVVLCMRLMTRVSPKVLDVLGDGDFVRCIHTLGVPRPEKITFAMGWACNPEKTIITHRPAEREIWSFGSGYGGNSLLGKKCFALRIAGVIARDEGWMAEHMLIMGVTSPAGVERFFTAAFPSACGKTNLAMLEPTLPGWKVRTIGDDIAWMRFRDDGQIVAINPEAGFFGVAPGTNYKTNPMAMACLQKNTIFTNTAETVEGEYFWEGLEKEIKNKDVDMIDWLGKPWKIGMETKAAHPNSRFTTPASQCPIIHPKWEDVSGVPIDAFIFGGRRPEGVPLVFESFNWLHGIFIGACLKSEATAAAEHAAGKVVMHDPMAMRPFMGYNFGRYLQHWINMGKPPHKVPRVYHVNWFRLTKDGKFLWPGFCDNIRVLAWITDRLNNKPDIAVETPIGYLPKKGSIDMSGLDEPVDWDELFSLPKDYWQEDTKEVRKFMEEQVGPDLPAEIRAEMDAQEQRIMAMK